jgi:hypothetical protein
VSQTAIVPATRAFSVSVIIEGRWATTYRTEMGQDEFGDFCHLDAANAVTANKPWEIWDADAMDRSKDGLASVWRVRFIHCPIPEAESEREYRMGYVTVTQV